ncbi:alpha/beta fold hydrolase [Streptomyces sp. SID4946]|uniref:alpha/beta fold hydrolase n=1 Tax=Streptomyces TaxID=1883 RepID=UPI00081F197C|nr:MULTISPECIES: alpha/beta hydrolase [unclassified Streptomyces]MYQ96600.1 alpha/beta fold hydrolase [Streptomyces sp. SID4946]SCG01248.1 Pimeloyl-ACP methyl ester carboxylesterase [Streptomyces sp. DconLS]SCG05677.1 Pimeloyl-ACP methyl ester carboxylesterase [Streptomyces sp. LamerLS-31b]
MTDVQKMPTTTVLAEPPVTVRLVRAATGPDPLRVLLVHGLCSSASVWDPYIALADERCELWAAELPWRGTGVEGWTARPVEDWVEVAVAMMPGRPDVVVAHSFGTSAALSWLDRAHNAPDLRAVVLVSPLYRSHTHSFDWLSIEYYLNNFVHILTEGMRAHSGRQVSEERRQAIAYKIRDCIGPYGWIRFFETYLRMPHVRTERMRMPFLVIGGAEDLVAFPSDARALGTAVQDASVHILPDSSHFPMASAPEAFADLVNAFLTERSASPR